MASRKRKSIGTRPTSQYDTRRFSSLDAWTKYTDNVLGRNILPERKVELYHTELDDFKTELERPPTFGHHFCSKLRKEGIFGVMKRISTCGTSKFQMIAPPDSIHKEDEGPTAQVPEYMEDESSEATIPEPFDIGEEVEETQATLEPSAPMVNLPLPQPAAHPFTPLLQIPEDPTTHILAMDISPPTTPILQLTNEEDEFAKRNLQWLSARKTPEEDELLN
ncbi:hypothetical protein JHK85_032384 [Glycine max]|nr:hypothetical protein JHK85_032384 [Glycine max]